jgi:hypothetical protein
MVIIGIKLVPMYYSNARDFVTPEIGMTGEC